MPQFLDDLSVTKTLHMQRPGQLGDAVRFTACFTIEAGSLRMAKTFDISDHSEARRALRQLADKLFVTWLETLLAELVTGKGAMAKQIDIDSKGWAKVVLHGNPGSFGDITLDVPEADDLGDIERVAIAKLDDILRRTLRHQRGSAEGFL